MDSRTQSRWEAARDLLEQGVHSQNRTLLEDALERLKDVLSTGNFATNNGRAIVAFAIAQCHRALAMMSLSTAIGAATEPETRQAVMALIDSLGAPRPVGV